MASNTPLERLTPALPAEVKNAIADALMDTALRDYTPILRDTVLNCRLAGRVFNNAIRNALFRCVYFSSRFASRGRKLVCLIESDPTLLSSIRHIDLTLDSSLMRVEARVVANLFSIFLHDKHSRIRSLRLAGDGRFSQDSPARWSLIMKRSYNLERAIKDLIFSPRLSRLEIVDFDCFPLRQVFSSCHAGFNTLRVKNVRSKNPSGRGFYVAEGIRETNWRRLELDDAAVEEVKWVFPQHGLDAREGLAHFQRVDELCIINPDLTRSTIGSDSWGWRNALRTMQQQINSLSL